MNLQDGYHDLPRGKLGMIVTDLEMRTQAPLRQAVLPKNLTFGPLVTDRDRYRDLFRRIGEDWLWFGRLVMPDEELDALLSHPEVVFMALFRDGVPEALLELDFRVSGACELAYFGVTRGLVATGAGAFLMDRAIELAFARRIDRFHLHTCTLDSPQALPFYVRSGFTPVGRRLEIADDPRLLGIYPDTAAPHVPML